MRYRLLAAVIVGVQFLGAPVGAEPGAKDELTAQERAGKRIYQRGHTDTQTPIYAWLGDPPIRVPARTLPCMNCHGFEGSGRPEGGVSPSNITWSSLTKSYGSRHPTGRRHAPYNESSLKRAITEGIDPSGNKLGVGMPKFTMSDADLDSLVAYLKRIEYERAAGVTDTGVTVATILPLDGELAAAGVTIRETLESQFEDINATGGLYNRTMNLLVVPTGRSAKESIDRLRQVLDGETVFALVAPYVPDGEDELIALAAEREIPVIAPLGEAPDDSDGPNRFLFYLSSGLSTQVRVLVDRCAALPADVRPARVCLVTRDDAPFTELAKVAREQFRGHKVALRAIDPYPATGFSPKALAKEWADADAVVFLGPGSDCVRVLRETSTLDPPPTVFLPGAFVGGEIFDSPPRYDGRIFAAFANSRHTQSPRAVEQYRGFLKRHGMAARGSATRLGAYCAGALFLEAVKRSGKDLRREQLIRQLEGFYKFETGLIPPLTFGPDRRVGAYGAYIASVDLAQRTLICKNRWIEPVE